MSRPKPARAILRTNISLPETMHRDLKIALVRRAALSRNSAKMPALSVSGWVREKALETIASFK